MRKAQKLSLSDLAHKSGVSRTYISDIELGRYVPTERVLDALKRALAQNLIDRGDVA